MAKGKILLTPKPLPISCCIKNNTAILVGALCSGYGLVIGIGWTLGDMAYGYYSGQSTTDVLNRYALLRW